MLLAGQLSVLCGGGETSLIKLTGTANASRARMVNKLLLLVDAKGAADIDVLR